MKTKPIQNDGFTLIELMMVVAIIGLLAAIALPKFADLVRKAREASVKGKLGTWRSALNLYYVNNEGIYPQANSLTSSLIPKYLSQNQSGDDVGLVQVPGYSHTEVLWTYYVVGGVPTSSNKYSYPFEDHTRWVYHRFNDHPTFHPPIFIFVGCTHTDTTGVTWSLW